MAMKINVMMAILLFSAVISGFSCEERFSGGKSKPNINTAEKLQETEWFEKRFMVFNGIPARVLFALPKEKSDLGPKLVDNVQNIFDKIDRLFNAFRVDSELGRINANPKPATISISGEFAKAYKIAEAAWKESCGAFDPTVFPLKNLWSEAKKKQAPPDEKAIGEALESVGMEKVEFSNQTLSLTKKSGGISLDFGGLAKGYAVDLIHDELKKNGVRHALVQCGGEIRSWGLNKKGKAFRIGIQNPLDNRKLYGSIGGLPELAVSTSGNYRQPIHIGGVTYYHIFDPKTGRPIPTDVLGVTVLVTGSDFPNSRADAWATAFAVLGPEDGMKEAIKAKVDVMFIVRAKGDAEPRIIMTEMFRRLFEPAL